MERRKDWRIAAVIGLSMLALTGCSQKTASHVEGLDALGTIRAYTREDDSGTRASWDDLLSITSEAEDLTEAVSTDDMQKAVADDGSAIGYLTQDAADESVKLLQVNGKDISDNGYPLVRRLYLVYKGEPSDLEREFLTYVTGKGQDIVSKQFEAVKKSVSFLSLKPKGTIKIGGSSSEAPVMEELAEAYMRENPNAEITVATTDSGDGINGAVEGTYDLGMSSRSPKEYEKNLLTFIPVAKDRIAVIVQSENPLDTITEKQLASIYTGKITDWADLG